MPASVLDRLFKRKLYTPADVDAIVAGTVDQGALEQTLLEVRRAVHDAGDREGTDSVDTAIQRIQRRDKVLDAAVIRRWRNVLYGDKG